MNSNRFLPMVLIAVVGLLAGYFIGRATVPPRPPGPPVPHPSVILDSDPVSGNLKGQVQLSGSSLAHATGNHDQVECFSGPCDIEFYYDSTAPKPAKTCKSNNYASCSDFEGPLTVEVADGQDVRHTATTFKHVYGYIKLEAIFPRNAAKSKTRH